MSAVKIVAEFRELPASVWKLLEERVDAFEAAWVDGHRPLLDDYLIAPDPTDGQLLIELICAEFEFRLQAGVPTTVDEYLERYPELECRPGTLERLHHLRNEIVPAQSMLASLCRDVSGTKPSQHRSKSELLEFAAEWESGNRPRIEDYLERGIDSDRSTLFLDLLATEISHRLERNESPQRQEYLQRFPSYELQLRSFDWGSELPADTSPQRVGEFELLERRGVGGFGTVWKARDRRLDRIVAIKIPHPHRLDAKGRSILVREARAAARLRHPNIVGIHQVEVGGKTPYIVLDYVEGVSLKKWLVAHPPNVNQAAGLCISLAHAVHHAHEQGVIHRDLKPANVLVDDAGDLHISDFGLAKRQTSEELETRDGLVMGSLPYMSPEQASGRSRTADARTDVYALGAILYEMLTGHPPFEGSEVSILRKIVDDEPAEPRRLRADTPAALEAICLRAMSKEPSERYASASALAADLGRYVRGEVVEATRLQRHKYWRRMRWQRPTLFAFVMIAIITGFGVWQRFNSGNENSAIAGPSQANVATLSVGGSLGVNVPSSPTNLQSAEATPGAIIDNRLAARVVEIRTDPPGAEIWLFPRDPITGWPQPKRRIDGKTKTPTRFDLTPGDYLIVADLGGGRFLELDHRIPLPDEIPIAEQSLSWMPNRADGSIYFEFDLPATPDLSEFVLVPASEHVVAKDTPEERRVRIPEFYLSSRLITVADYFLHTTTHAERNGRKWTPKVPDDAAGIAIEPEDVLPLKFCRAELLASKAGCRLPDEFEWELAASVGLIPADDAEVHAEWTSSWFNSFPWTLNDDAYRAWRTLERTFAHREDYLLGRPHVVRGVNKQFLGDPAIVASSDISISSRRPGQFFGFYPEVGFRLARSVKPRRESEDFIQILP